MKHTDGTLVSFLTLFTFYLREWPQGYQNNPQFFCNWNGRHTHTHIHTHERAYNWYNHALWIALVPMAWFCYCTTVMQNVSTGGSRTKATQDPFVCNFLWVENCFKIKRFFFSKRNLKRENFLTICSGLFNITHKIISCTEASQTLGTRA